MQKSLCPQNEERRRQNGVAAFAWPKDCKLKGIFIKPMAVTDEIEGALSFILKDYLKSKRH